MGSVVQAPNKHQQRTAATRQKLIDAAYRVFVRDGFEGARIEDIAAEAGFTRGAFYAHFESKNDLFLALLQDRSERNAQKLRRLLKDCNSPESFSEVMRDFYLEMAGDRAWAVLATEFKLFAYRKTQIRAQLAAAHRDVRKKMAAMLAQQVPQCGDWTDDRHETVKAGLEGALLGIVLDHAYDPRRLTDAEIRQLLGRIFDALITE